MYWALSSPELSFWSDLGQSRYSHRDGIWGPERCSIRCANSTNNFKTRRMPWSFSQMYYWDIVPSWYSGNWWSWGPLGYPWPALCNTNGAGLAEHCATNSDKKRYIEYKSHRACLLRRSDHLLRLELWQTRIFRSKKTRAACICLQSWAVGWAKCIEEGVNKPFQNRTLASRKQYVKSGAGLRSLQFVR